MNVVSRRFRRASLAGLAAFVTAGGAVLATAGSAWAAELNVDQQSTGATTVYPGQSGVAAGDLQVDFQNSFSIGDTITISLVQPGPGCGTTNGAVGFAGTPTVTVSGPTTGTFGSGTAGNSADTKPTFTVATQSSAGACTVAGIKDQLIITLTNSSTGTNTDYFMLSITGQKLNIGSAVTAGAVDENAQSGTTPVGKNTTIANVSFFKVTTSVVPAAPNATGVALQPISATDVPGGQITADITFTLDNSGQFTSGGTLAAPAGVTATLSGTQTFPSATLTYTLTGTTPANGTFTLSGAVVTVGGTAGDTQVSVTTKGGTAVGSGNVVVTANTTRNYAGVDRYATAAALFNAHNNATDAVIASGTSYADGLSADVLASSLGTGVLLTDPNSLPNVTKNALLSNGISTVYIVGGTAAVSANVESQIAALHVLNNPANPLITVYRIAGSDRYQTNMQVNLTAGPTGTAVIATGTNFADALAVSPEVYAKNYALVLTDPNSLSSSAQSTLTNLGITNVIIVGGTSAVSANVESQLKSAGITVLYRIAGADRTGTAAQIATWATAGLPAANGYNALASLNFNMDPVELTRGDTFPDALAAGPAVGNAGDVLLLTANPTTLGSGAGQYLGGKGGTVTTFDAIGFAAAVSPSVVNAAIAALG